MRESKNNGYHSKSDRKVRRSGSSQSIRRRRRRLLVEGLESRIMLAGDRVIYSLTDLSYDESTHLYSYDAGHPAGARSRVTFAANIETLGKSISVDADEIYVDPSITIDTSNPNAKAGNISFAAHTKVYLSDNSKLLANGINDSQDGSITISASHDLQTRAYVTAINMVENLINAFTSPAEVTILSGVTIDGGDITIQTENGNHKMEYGSAVQDQFKKAWKVFASASPIPSSILSLPVTFQDWRPKARITINQASDKTNTTNTTKILGSSSVTIGADAHASAVGKAVSASIPQMMFNKSGNNPNGWFGQKYFKTAWSVGVFLTDPEATVDIRSTIVSSSGDVSISSDVENTISLTAKSTLNTGAGKTNPAGKAVSFAFSDQASTSTVYVDSNSLISTQGNVSITADANNSTSTTSSSAVYRDGTVGFAPAIADNHTDVRVTIDGKVTAISSTAGGSVQSLPPSYNSTFNPTFSVDIPTSTVTLSGIPLYKTGDAIALFSEEGGTLPGLAAGLYYVIVTPNSDNTYSLQFASSYEDALALKYISFGDAYPTLRNTRTNLTIPVTQTATDTQQQSLILFGDANGPDGATPLFQDGDPVEFTSAAKRFLGHMPTSGQLVELDQTASYRVKIVESKSKTYPLSIQLLDENNNPLNLFGGSYLQSEAGVRYPIGSIDLDQGQIDLRIRTLDSTGENITYTSPATPVSNGQKLVFHAGLSAASETLQDGDSFWAIVDPNESGVIRLALSAEQAEAANPAVQDALAHLTATFKGLQIPLTPDGKPSGLQAGQNFSIQTNGSTKTFVFSTGGALYGNWPDGTVAVKLATDSAQEQADEIISAISQANIGLKASYQGSGKIAVGTQSDLRITSSSVLQAADIPVDIPIGNFEAGVGLVFLDDPNLVDNLSVVYHAVPGKPMRGLVDGRVYHVYNVPNTNYNPVVPQYILTLMDGLEVSSNADSGSFELKITAPNGTSATTVPLAWNISAEDLQSQINSLGLPDLDVRVRGLGTTANPWYIDGVNLEAVALQNSSLRLNGIPTAAKLQQASPRVLMDSDADAGTFTLEVTGSDGIARKTGDLAWNISASQLQVAINGLALSGVYVNVEGSGTAEDPWLIDGVKPSQFAIDSAKLLKGTKSTNMQMTSARQVQFYNGQSMDDATGHQFPITGSDRDNGTLTIMLPDNAPILSADSTPLIGDGINAPVVAFEAIPVNTLEIFSIANAGTFTLSFTDASGIEHTSSDLAFDATPSQIAAAIFAISGDSVSVTGRGRIGSPWMVTGLTVEQITSESKMVNPLGDPTELIGQISDGAGYRIWVEHAQGGTFTLTLDNTLEHVTTAPISFNATTSDLFSALRALPGITAQVTGAGTSDDPWIVQTGALPIRTGDPLVFRDSWGMPGLGMIDGRTYYAIVLEQSDDPREITLQLTATLEGAEGGSSDWGNIAANQHIEMRPYLPLVPASAPGLNGKPVTLYGTSDQAPDGITITAGLDSSHSIGSYANLGGFPLLSYALGVNQFGSLLNKGNKDIDGTDSWIENLIKNRIPVGMDNPNQWEFVGAAALQGIDNKVEVIVGRTAEVGTDGTLTIHSDINQTLSTVSNAGLSKTNSNNENWAVAVAFAFSNVSNTSKAIVSSNAIVTGGYGVDIDSKVSYVPPAHWPFIRQVDQLFKKDQEFWKHILSEMETLFSDIFLGDLGLLTANFNTVANVGIARIGGTEKNHEEVMRFVGTGSFAYEIIHNENLAQIADGAKVNVPSKNFTTYNRLSDSQQEIIISQRSKWLADNRTLTVGFTSNGTLGPDARIRLNYDTELTEWIHPSASASEVQSALEGLKLIGIGNVSVSVDPNRPHEWKIQLLKESEEIVRRQLSIQTKNIDNPKLYQTDEDNNTPTHGVSVVAETNAKQWGLGGQLYFSLPYLIHGLVSGDGSSIAKSWREGGPFRSAAKNAFGGSVSLLTMDGSTQALLGGYDTYYDPKDASTTPDAQSTDVYYGTGNEGGLRISANTRNGVVQVAQASAKSSGFGFEGSVAYVTMGEPHSDIKSDDRRQKTYAKMIASTVPQEVYPISLDSDGGISVKANDQSFGWAITGSLLIGQSKGIGLSGSVIELTRDVQSSIGSQLASIDPYSPTNAGNLIAAVPGSHISTNGSIDVQSTLSGTVVPLALVGEFSVRSSEAAQDAAQDNANGQGENEFFRNFNILPKKEFRLKRFKEVLEDLKKSWDAEKDNHWLTNNEDDGEWGFFVSGDFSGAFVEDQVFSYVDAPGNLTGANAANSKLAVSSGNSTTINPGAGAFALQFSKESTSNKTGGFAGSVAWADVNTNVQAWVQSSSLDQLGLNVLATNSKRIGGGAAGLQVDSPTGFDLQVMGSVVINTIDNTTKALIDQTTQTNAGDISVNALQADEIFGLAGTAQLSIAPFRGKTVVGFGMSAAWHETNNKTDASIQRSTISQTQGNTSVTANDFTESEARSFGAQVVVTAGNVIEIGGMWTANLLFPNTSSTISDSHINNTSDQNEDPKLTATAWLNPWMVSFAGYFSFGVSTGEKDIGQVGVGVASVTARVGSEDDDIGDATAEYATTSKITDSTITGFYDVCLYSLTGEQSDQTTGFFGDSQGPGSTGDEASWNIHSLAIAGGMQAGAAPLTFALQGATVATRQHVDTISTIVNSQIRNPGEVQRVGYETSDKLIDGTFTLEFDGQTTDPIPVNADAATVQAALENLSKIGAGNIAVTKDQDSDKAQSWIITFQNALGHSSQQPITIITGNLSPQSSTRKTIRETLFAYRGDEPNVDVLSFNQLTVHTDAGGVAASLSFGESGNAIAAGFALNLYHSQSETVASIDDSKIDAASATISALLKPYIENYAFGVAVSAGTNLALGGSGADLNLTQQDSAQAWISRDSVITTTGDLSINATDESFLRTWTGSGSLAIGGEIGGIAAGGVGNFIKVRNNVLAYLGSKPNTDRSDDKPDLSNYGKYNTDTTAVTVGGALSVESIVGQTIKNFAFAVAVAGGSELGLAGSGASSKIFLANIALATINSATVTMSGSGTMTVLAKTLGKDPDYDGKSDPDISDRTYEVFAHVGDVAASGGSYGASIGISLGLITNDDLISAQVQDSIINTGGGEIAVEATDHRNLVSNVWVTSIAIALGAAGGGGHSFVYSQPNVIAELGNGTSVLPNDDKNQNFSDLSVQATGQESIHASIFGGVGGLVAIGDMISEADKHGTIWAGVGSVAALTTAKLAINAIGKHGIDAHGLSYGAGGITISGDGHRFTYDEQIFTAVGTNLKFSLQGASYVALPDQNVSISTINSYGEVTLSSLSSTQAYASGDGRGDGGNTHSGSWGLIALGFFHSSAIYSPTIKTQTSDVTINYGGSVTVQAGSEQGISQSRAMTASGSIVGGDQTKAENTVTPDVEIAFENASITALDTNDHSVIFAATVDILFDTYADSLALTVLGGGAGARVVNTLAPSTSINFSGDNLVKSNGDVSLISHTAMTRTPNEDDEIFGHYNDEHLQNSSRGGGGGLVAVDAATIETNFNGTTEIVFSGGTSTSIVPQDPRNNHGKSNKSPSNNISIRASQQIDIQDLASQDTGGLAGGASAKNTLGLTLSTKILSDDSEAILNLDAGQGTITVATAIDVNTYTKTVARNGGLIAASSSEAKVAVDSTETIRIGSGTTVTGNEVTVSTGTDAGPWGIVDFAPGINAVSSAASKSDVSGNDPMSDVEIAQSNSILSNAKVVGISSVTFNQGYESTDGCIAMKYGSQKFFGDSSWNQEWDAGSVSVDIDQQALLSVNNSIYAGHETFGIEADTAGLSVNGLNYSWQTPDPSNPANYKLISPESVEPSTNFTPFLSLASHSIDTALSLVMDQSSLNTFKANYQASSSNSAIAYTLKDLFVPQGSIQLIADRISGTAAVKAYVPKLNIVNQTDNWLILDGISSYTNPNAGKITLHNRQGDPISAPSLNIVSNEGSERTINVSVSQDNGNSKPFMIIAGYLNSPSSEVTLTNNYGPIIELAPIHAASVTINVPNSAFAVYTPGAYFGTGGNSQLAFEDAINANALNPASDVNTSSTNPFLPGLTVTGTGTKYDANYVASAASDYINRTSTSRIPIYSSGSSSVIASHLGSGINAAQIAVFAKTIDINAPLTIGRKEEISVVLSESLGETLRQHQADYNSGLQSDPLYTIPIGDNSVQGFDEFVPANSSYSTAITASQMTLTDGSMNMARAGWYKTPVPISDDFTISFTYRASGNKRADGIALVLQNQGTSVVGNDGSSLGYVGIPGSTAAYQINLYGTSGSNFVTTNSSGTYQNTGPVDFRSGHRIRVTLAYDAARQQVIEQLTDLDNSDSSKNSHTSTYSGINLSQIGRTAYIGFTGASGSLTSVQTVSDFSMVPHQILNGIAPLVSAIYDARTNEITLSSIALTERIRVVLDGEIISTIGGSRVSLMGGLSGQGIQNYTGIPLVLNNIDSGPGGASGTVEFRDTLTQTNTRYIYTSSGISVYTAHRGHNYDATPDNVSLSESVDFQPKQDLLYVSSQRQDIFKVASSSSVFSSGNPSWYPASMWNYGDVSKIGFAGFQTVNAALITAQNQLTLTTSGTGSTANAAWLQQPIDVTRSFLVSYRYEGSGDGDGVAFALQAAGTGVVGGSGGELGYSGIAGNKAAFMINLYDYKNGPHPGVNFDFNENWGKSYDPISPIAFSSPIEVQLYYDANQKKWFAFLADGNGNGYTKSFEIDLSNTFGSNRVYAGFTGSTGLKSSTQSLRNFLLVYDPQTVPTIAHLESDLVHVVNPQISGFTGFGPAGYLTADSISADTITFANYDNFSNRQRAAWYGEKFSTDVDTLSVDFTYQASFQTPKIEGFDDFVPQNTSYASAITPGKITLTNGSQNVARAAWLGGEIGTKDDFEINFKYQTDGKVVQGFSNFAAPTNTTSAATISSDQITLTDGSTSIARAAWNKEQVPINYGFTIDFTYQASGNRDADGVAMVFQTQGTNVVGDPGGSLGYVGIAGNKAAYQINIFGGNSQTQGSNFVTGNTSGSYNKTGGIGGVDFSNGNRIHVRLTYDPISHQIFESLTDLDNNNTYSHTYSNINLASVLGTSQAYIGFTGSSGGKTSVQTVKDFYFQSNQADGIALVFQKQGTGAIGNGGGDLGYVGILGAKAAYQINLFTDSNHTRGSNFVTSNTSGTYNSTGSVNFASGHPIQVQLSYNSHAHQLTERLTDLISNTTYTKTYNNINFAGLLGSTTYVGFTGGSGAVTAVQSVEDFSLESFPDDGVALVFQSAGTQVSGSAEDGLGYVGISGPTAAYQINLKSNGLQGSNFVSTNTAGTYLSTGAVDFASRNPIHVQLSYSNTLRQLTESLTNTVTKATFSRTYNNFDLASALGPTAYVGFTAPRGGPHTQQSISDFHFSASLPPRVDFKQRFAAQPLSKSSDSSTTSYATDFNTWLRADNPIHVDFSGLSSNGLNVMSNASLTLNGLIRVSDIVSLTTTNGTISTTSTGSITARSVGLSAKGDGALIGTSTVPVSVSLVNAVNGSGYLSAGAANGIYISSPGDLTVGYISTYSPTDQSDSPVAISASGNILTLAPPQQSFIYAGSLTLKSGGVIGSALQPLQVQLVPHTLDNGSTVSGLLNAQAAGDIELVMLGDVRVGRLSTPKTVSITTAPVKDSTGNVISQGNIFDGFTLDALKLNDPNLSPQNRKNFFSFLTTPFPDNSDQSIASLQRSVNSAYLQYWQLIPVTNFPIQPPAWNNWDPGDWGDVVTIIDSEGNPQQIYQLTAAGIDAFRPQVTLVYEQENPSDSDIQDYANRIWKQCVATFSSTDAFGPDWANKPPFFQFDTNFNFQASNETVAKIKASYQESFDIFTYLSTQALAHPSVASAISKIANIQAGNLTLKSTGSIGHNPDPMDIPLDHFQNNTLTTEELQLVRFASQAGELQLIGKNTAGETTYYDAGSAPDNVTLTGVRVKISRPLMVQLAASGSLSATSSSELLIASTSGDLNVKSASSTSNGFVWLDSAGNLLVADGSTGTTVSGGNMRLDAGQAIGSSNLPLVISASGKVDLSSLGDASIKSASTLNLGQWDVVGDLTLQSNGTGAITDALASQRSSFAGFNTNGAGWTTTASPSSPANGPSIQGFGNFVAKDSTYANAITSSQIQLTNGTGNLTRAAWLQDQIPTNHNFTLQFTYQASGYKQADGVAMVFQTQGTNVVGTSGGGLGYVGIAGNKAAYQINIYNGHTIGSNFVTANTSGTYSTTGSVNFASGHQIQVTLTYDVQKNTVTETLKDLSTNATYTKTYSNINLASVLGASSAFIGFTGSSGGQTAIQAVSNFSLQLTEPATVATVTSSNSDDQLTLTLQSATNSTETWPSHVAFAKNDTVQLSDHFTFGFIYQSNAIGSRLALDLGRADQSGLALVLNLGNADGSGAWADFVNSSEIETTTSGQSLGSLRLNSNNPIRVTLTYSLLTQAVIATLTDTVTQNAASIQQSVNIIQRLGGRSASISLKAFGDGAIASSHKIHEFRLIDGAVNLSASSLNGIAGGAFGTLAVGSLPARPILMLIDGETQINAGAAIVAQQVLGDLEVGSIVSPTTINITAPFGAVVQYVPPSGSGSGGEGDSVTLGLVAPSVELNSLLGIGSSNRRVMVTTGDLSARTAINDLLLYHQGPEDQSQSIVTYISAGGTVDLVSDSHLSVTGPIVGSQARFHSILAGNAVRLSLAQLRHIFGGPLDVSISGYSSLEVDDSQATEGHELSIAQNRISTHSASILLGMVQSLGLSLGDGSDQVRVHDASGLSSLEIRGSGGDDQISIANAALAIKQMLIGSGLGEDILDIDLLNTGAWVTKNAIETAFGRIDHLDISHLNLNRLETTLDAGSIATIQRVLADFPADRLLIVGTTGPESLSLTSLASELRFSNFWNSVTMEEKIYKRSAINDIEMYLLGGDDSVLVNGSAGVQLDIHGGRGNDTFLVQDVGVSITDLYGNNRVKTAGGADRIHTGAGDDQINAAGGENQIWDDGGMNSIFSGDQNDVIRHSNVSDWISAGGGTNSIYLNGQLRRWQNQNQPMDVNRDGYASPLDALMVIDRINRFGMGSMNGSADSTVGFYDVDGDGSLTPLDALVVIDWLNKRISGEGENSLHDVANFDTASDLSQDLSATKKPIKKSDDPMSVNLGSNKRRSYEDYYDAVFASLDKDDFE